LNESYPQQDEREQQHVAWNSGTSLLYQSSQ
jgi:hypothetical protein